MGISKTVTDLVKWEKNHGLYKMTFKKTSFLVFEIIFHIF